MPRILLVAILLGGCTASPPDMGSADRLEPADAAPASDTSVIPDDLVISTNEPFWQARIDGDTLVLTGVDSDERRLAVETSDTTADRREVRARDARGTVEASVSDRACQDSMAGAHFPLTGELTIGGAGSFPGCARPAPMPAPGEPHRGTGDATEIPGRWHGIWAPSRDACRDPADIERLTIAARELRFHESIGVPSAVEATAADTLRVTAEHEGEGQRWTSTRVLRLSDDGDSLQIEGPGDARMQRIRCEPQSR